MDVHPPKNGINRYWFIAKSWKFSHLSHQLPGCVAVQESSFCGFTKDFPPESMGISFKWTHTHTHIYIYIYVYTHKYYIVYIHSSVYIYIIYICSITWIMIFHSYFLNFPERKLKTKEPANRSVWSKQFPRPRPPSTSRHLGSRKRRH